MSGWQRRWRWSCAAVTGRDRLRECLTRGRRAAGRRDPRRRLGLGRPPATARRRRGVGFRCDPRRRTRPRPGPQRRDARDDRADRRVHRRRLRAATPTGRRRSAPGSRSRLAEGERIGLRRRPGRRARRRPAGVGPAGRGRRALRRRRRREPHRSRRQPRGQPARAGRLSAGSTTCSASARRCAAARTPTSCGARCARAGSGTTIRTPSSSHEQWRGRSGALRTSYGYGVGAGAVRTKVAAARRASGGATASQPAASRHTCGRRGADCAPATSSGSPVNAGARRRHRGRPGARAPACRSSTATSTPR